LGLFKSIRRITRKVRRQVSRVQRDIIEPAIPIALGVAGGIVGGQLLGGLLQGAGGAEAIAQSNLAQGNLACPAPTPGFVGNQVPSANPITRAFISPGFDVNRLPARPAFGRFQQFKQFLAEEFPQPQPFQNVSDILPGRFGEPTRPTFRSFTPSFRSGRPQLPVRVARQQFDFGQVPAQVRGPIRGFGGPSFPGFGF